MNILEVEFITSHPIEEVPNAPLVIPFMEMVIRTEIPYTKKPSGPTDHSIKDNLVDYADYFDDCEGMDRGTFKISGIHLNSKRDFDKYIEFLTRLRRLVRD